MRAAWMAALAALGAIVAGGGARADGVAMLDRLDGTRGDLEAASADAGLRMEAIDAQVAAGGLDGATKKALRKERAALARAVKAAGKAAPLLGDASGALVAHDMKTFLAASRKGATALAKAEAAFGGAFLDAGATEALSGTLGEALAEARGAVDVTASADAAAAGRADAEAARAADFLAEAKPQKASARFLAGMEAILDLPIPAQGGHRPVRLRALNGGTLNPALGVAPYSPKRTCGECHDYDLIAQGYHFDQGRREVRDDYASGKPIPSYVLSDGMYGRW